MEANEWVRHGPVPTGLVVAVDDGDGSVRLGDHGIGERQAHGTGADHKVVGIDFGCHESASPVGRGLRESGCIRGFKPRKKMPRASVRDFQLDFLTQGSSTAQLSASMMLKCFSTS